MSMSNIDEQNSTPEEQPADETTPASVPQPEVSAPEIANPEPSTSEDPAVGLKTPEDSAAPAPKSDDGDDFNEMPYDSAKAMDFAEKETVTFLELADLDQVQTQRALTGRSESEILKKIAIADSFLTINEQYCLLNLGGPRGKDYEKILELVEVYRGKLSVIEKRLGI